MRRELSYLAKLFFFKCAKTFTIYANFPISILVGSSEECFGLLIGKISAICRKALQHKPNKGTNQEVG